MTTRPRFVLQILRNTCVAIAAFAVSAYGATLPAGFTESLVASGLNTPTAMQFAPDGRLFVCEQNGRLRVIKNGALLSTPFLTVTVSSSGERGLLGVAFDPDFAVNQFVYVYYTATSPTIHNRVSRFTASGDVAAPGSEVVLLDLENLTATNHNGGALAFGPDDKLYIAVGENAVASNAQSLSNRLGKVLRLNKDGSIPTDNPFYTTATGGNRAIWALGLRNPFTFAFSPSGTSMFINDVGQGTWEEINDGAAGANYGWPDTEGATTDPRFVTPRYSYPHSERHAARSSAARSTRPMTAQFPERLPQRLFLRRLLRRMDSQLDPANGNSVTTFATGISSPVDLKVADDGSLYYLARGVGRRGRIESSYGATAPTITSHPSSRTVAPGTPVTFSVRASGPAPLRYQWQRNGANITGATSQDYTIASPATTDSGARFRAVVSNDFGSTTSAEAVLTVNVEPGADRDDHRAGRRRALQRRREHQLRGHRLRSGGRHAAGERLHLAGGLPPRYALAPVHAGDERCAASGTFTIPTTGRDLGERLVPHLPDGSRRRRRDPHGRSATSFRARYPLTLATSPRRLAAPARWPAGRRHRSPSTRSSASSGASTRRRRSRRGRPATNSCRGPTAARPRTPSARHRRIPPTPPRIGPPAARAAAPGSTPSTSTTPISPGRGSHAFDPTVDFTWGAGSPAGTLGVDTFSARWTGQIEAPFTGTYTFYTQSDDGVRLWVNGVQLVNHWNNHATYEDRGTITLTAGQRYPIKMEYYENAGSATARLLWSHASITKAVVPASRLYPSAAPANTIRVNFQLASAPIPAGYLPDGGLVYGARGNGQTYGWNTDNTAQARDRNSSAIARSGLRHADPHAAPGESRLRSGKSRCRTAPTPSGWWRETRRTSTVSTGSPPKAC